MGRRPSGGRSGRGPLVDDMRRRLRQGSRSRRHVMVKGGGTRGEQERECECDCESARPRSPLRPAMRDAISGGACLRYLSGHQGAPFGMGELGHWKGRRSTAREENHHSHSPVPRSCDKRPAAVLQPLALSASSTPFASAQAGLDWTGLVCSEPDATGQERAVGCAGEAFQHGHGHAWAYSCLPARRFARGDVEVLL
jgi:hypothetical protein